MGASNLFNEHRLAGVLLITDRASFQPPQGAPDMEDVLTSAAREDIHLELPDHG